MRSRRNRVHDSPLERIAAAVYFLCRRASRVRRRGRSAAFRCPAKHMSDPPRRTQIPLPGSSGETPTGAMQFQRDWPGLFNRGDDAIFIAISIRELEAQLSGTENVRIASALCRLSKIADVIERDVKVRPGEAH